MSEHDFSSVTSSNYDDLVTRKAEVWQVPTLSFRQSDQVKVHTVLEEILEILTLE